MRISGQRSPASIVLVLVAAAAWAATPALADVPDPSVSPEPTVVVAPASVSPSEPAPAPESSPDPESSPAPESSPDPAPTLEPSAEPSPVPVTSPTPVGAVKEGRARAGERTDAAVRDNRFAPIELTVSAGTQVVWTNEGQNPHTVTANDRTFDSGTLQSGQTFAVTFDAEGRFPYYCQIHGEPGSGMFAVVIVRAAQTGATATPSPGPADDVGGTAETGSDPILLALLAGALGVGLLSLRLARARRPEGR